MEYRITERIAEIGQRGKETIELNRIKWGNMSEKFDLRRWKDGNPLKGITLTDEEAEALFRALAPELGYTLRETEDSNAGDDADKEDGYQDGDLDEEIEYEIDFRTFFIHSNECYLEHDYHDCKNIIARCSVIAYGEVREIEFPAKHCRDCDLYMIEENTYKQILRKGRPLCQIVSEDEYEEIKKKWEYYELNSEGILHMFGYSVSEKDGLNDGKRHSILDYIIECGILTKKEIVDRLKFFIKLSEHASNKKKAIDKWMDDIDYVLNVSEAEAGTRRVGVARIVNHNN